MQVTKHTSTGIQPSFETQGRPHPKSKTGASVEPQKSYKFFVTGSVFEQSLHRDIIVNAEILLTEINV